MSATVPPPVMQNPIYQIVLGVLNLLTLLVAAYAAQVGTQNHAKITGVEQKQADAAVKQDEAKATAEDVRAKLDAKAEDDAKALGVQLYSTWKYLDDVAAQSGSAKDSAKAAEAKAAYEGHVKRSAKKP